MSATTTRPAPGRLRPRAVGLAASTVLSLASTAPAYSLAVTVGLLVGLVGDRAPLVLVAAALPVALVVLCFRELNRAEPDCGTCYAWTTRALGPVTGWLTGWVAVAACVLVLANLAQASAVYAFTVVGADDLAASRVAQGLLGTALVALVTWLAVRGITVAARTQVVLFAVEAVALVWVAARALATAPLPEPTASAAAAPAGVGAGAVAAALLVAVFLYWGWDSSFSVNEESVEPTTTPARAALLAMAGLVVLYAGTTAALLAWAGPDRLAAIGEDDLFAVLGDALLGSTGGTVLAGAVLASALASTQTTVLPAARAALAMARRGALPTGLAEVTPAGSPARVTWAVAGLATAVYLALLATSEAVLADSVAATGVLVAGYYAVTAAAVPAYFGRAARERPLARVVVPLLTATTFAAVLVVSLRDLAATSTTSLAAVLAVLAVGAGYLTLVPTARRTAP
ncbi:amino acid permease [Nocardioides perillae]|uniref:Amino acid transporter n=1 Tax=Nocardioides perillae TaxID=1119534 RepID=A0A7Y9RVF4_9ACTN|nr:amino acid transporter [Nocardioides perillae]